MDRKKNSQGKTSLEFRARHLLKRLPVPADGLLDDVLGQLDALDGLLSVGRQPVAHKLLVEALLGTAGLVGIPRPVAGRVGREDLVNEDQRAFGRGRIRARQQAKLELCVGEDESYRLSVLGRSG